jgi:hypothetical protein
VTSTRRPLGPGTNRQEPTEVVAGARRTAVERAAEAALAPVEPLPARPTGRRPLVVREEPTTEDQAPSAGAAEWPLPPAQAPGTGPQGARQ